jgi:hypothetical protein
VVEHPPFDVAAARARCEAALRSRDRARPVDALLSDLPAALDEIEALRAERDEAVRRLVDILALPCTVECDNLRARYINGIVGDALDAYVERRAAPLRDERDLAIAQRDAAISQGDRHHAEIAELRATLANERGEGEPPCEGARWIGDGWRVRVGEVEIETSPIGVRSPSAPLRREIEIVRDGYSGKGPRYTTHREALKAADAALRGGA